MNTGFSNGGCLGFFLAFFLALVWVSWLLLLVLAFTWLCVVAHHNLMGVLAFSGFHLLFVGVLAFHSTGFISLAFNPGFHLLFVGVLFVVGVLAFLIFPS